MKLEQLKNQLQGLGYHSFYKNQNQILAVAQFTNKLNALGNPAMKTFCSIWIENDKYIMNYRFRLGTPDLREFTSPEPIISMVLEEFPLLSKQNNSGE